MRLRVRCPKCHILGSVEAHTYPGTDEIKSYECTNRRCKWETPVLLRVRVSAHAGFPSRGEKPQ